MCVVPWDSAPWGFGANQVMWELTGFSKDKGSACVWEDNSGALGGAAQAVANCWALLMLLAVGFSVMSVASQRSTCMLSLLDVVELLVVSEMQMTLQWTCWQPWQKKPYERTVPLVRWIIKTVSIKMQRPREGTPQHCRRPTGPCNSQWNRHYL